MLNAMQTHHKLALIGTLYISEGLPYGFFTQALPVLLRESGLSLKQIGLTGLLALPWMLKFLWAPLVDRVYSTRHGRRRSWIIPVQFATAVILVWTAFLSPDTSLFWVFVAVFLCNVTAATMDIATDGLAVQLLLPKERGLGNGVQVAGYRVGMLIAGGLLLIVFEAIGWRASFLLLASLILLFSLPIVRFNEPRLMIAEASHSNSSGKAWHYVLIPGVAVWLLMVFAYKFGDATGAAMVKPFFVDAGLSIGEIGWVIGTVGFGAALLGAMLGGALCSRFDPLRCVLTFGVLQAVGCLMYWWLAVHGLALMMTAVLVEHLASGMVTAAMFTLMMGACRTGYEGTDYTAQACVFVVATGVAGVVGGAIGDAYGWPAYFLIGAGLVLLGLLPLVIAELVGGINAMRLGQRHSALEWNQRGIADS